MSRKQQSGDSAGCGWSCGRDGAYLPALRLGTAVRGKRGMEAGARGGQRPEVGPRRGNRRGVHL
eukprot:15758-Eustigmatos_ZCMA.PRE.1